MKAMDTYHVSGTLEKDTPWGASERQPVCREIEAGNEQAAILSIAADMGNGWAFLDQPTVWLVTEAMKLEQAGEVSLFPLPPKG